MSSGNVLNAQSVSEDQADQYAEMGIQSIMDIENSQATAHFEKALGIYQQTVGENHVKTIEMSVIVPLMKSNMLGIMFRYNSESDPGYLQMLSHFASLLSNPSQSSKIYEHKLDVVERDYGVEHELFTQSVYEYARMYLSHEMQDEANALYAKYNVRDPNLPEEKVVEKAPKKEEKPHVSPAEKFRRELENHPALEMIATMMGKDLDSMDQDSLMEELNLPFVGEEWENKDTTHKSTLHMVLPSSYHGKLDTIYTAFGSGAATVSNMMGGVGGECQGDPQEMMIEWKQMTAMRKNRQYRPLVQFLQTTSTPLKWQNCFVANALNAPEDNESLETALNVVLESKGIDLESASHEDPEFIQKRHQLRTAWEAEWELSQSEEDAANDAAVRELIERKMTPLSQEDYDNLKALEKESEFRKVLQEFTTEYYNERANAQTLQRALIEGKGGIYEDFATTEKVLQRMPANSILIEYVKYREPTGTASSYAALVLYATGQLSVYKLGDENEIDDLVATYRKRLSEVYGKGMAELRDLEITIRSASYTLYQQLIAPLGLPGQSKLFISPEGSLHLLSFDTLVDESNLPLVEKYAISYLGSGRDLLSFDPVVQKGEFYVFADVDYSSPVEVTGVTNKERWGKPLEPLSGTAESARAIASLYGLDDNHVFTGDRATEKNLFSLSDPWRLHIATHGYFLSEKTDIVGSSIFAPVISETAQWETSLERSGLALAGFDNGVLSPYTTSDSDGVVTSYELASMDLQNTDLVVLSACDTGVGDVLLGEGVLGLHRSLKIAGAQTVVMSLWEVGDWATKELMVSFYRHLLEGETKETALRKAILLLKQNPSFSNPYYWGGFILTGNPE